MRPATHDLRVVFIGMNHDFSVAPLRALAGRCNLVGIIESIHPDPNLKYGKSLINFATHLRAPLFSMDAKARPTQFLQTTRPDVICIAGMAQLLRPEEFQIARLGALNLHPSLLPNYRGPDPFFWQARQMDLDGGVTVIQVDQDVDTGDILAHERFPISPGEPFSQIVQKMTQAGSRALVNCLDQLAAGALQPQPQRHLPCPLYARFPRAADWQIDWQTWPLQRVWHFLRAAGQRNPTVPFPRSKSQWQIGEIQRTPAPAPAGTYASDGDGYYLSHPQGRIRLEIVPRQPIVGRIFRRIRRQLTSR